MAKIKIWLAGMAIVAGITVTAQAEVLEMTGEFAARFREVSLLRSLSIGRLEGQDGPALANAIERYLGGTPFELMGGRAGRDNAEGSLSGGVTGGTEETPYKRKEKRCVERDKNDKCIKEAEVEVRCRKRIINLQASLRIVSNRNGRILYSAQKPFRNEVSWCEGQNAPATVEEVASGAVEQMAREVRYDIAPYRDTYRIRVRESSKGMSKDAAKRFKSLITQTKRDPRGACAGWDSMRGELGNHPSLLFNLGLCAEQRGDYSNALSWYRTASQNGSGEAGESINRTSRLIAGREDAAIRARN